MTSATVPATGKPRFDWAQPFVYLVALVVVAVTEGLGPVEPGLDPSSTWWPWWWSP
ncbi:MAG TPA: hypothetical protein VK060_04485 [Ruania sp.]|nr:hypothetical protein [Ruania sp.]